VNIRILAIALLLTGCDSSTRDDSHSTKPELQDLTEEVEIVEDQSLSFVLEYPSPPSADSSAQFHDAIKDLEKRLTDEGISYNTQGFLGNHFLVHGSALPAKQLLLDYSKTSPYKLNFLPQSEDD